MIFLITGSPGAGKSLYALNFVVAAFAGRPIYYHGISDLRLPWTEVTEPKDWPTLIPKRGVFVLDECQTLFRPRTISSTVPLYVSELETHRHRGQDLVFITQDPMLVDANVRRLVGIHFHVVRAWGMHHAVVHEWNACKENAGKPGARSDSVKHQFRYPAESFSWYKSAEVHTVKRRVPARVLIFLLLPIVIGVAAWAAYRWQSNFATQGVAAAASKAGTGVGGAVAPGARALAKDRVTSVREYLVARAPRVDGLPQSAPVYDGVTSPKVAPYPAACINSRSQGCKCYSQQGTVLATERALCLDIVAKGFFVDWVSSERVVGVVAGGSTSGAGAGELHSIRGGAKRAASVGPVSGEGGMPAAAVGPGGSGQGGEGSADDVHVRPVARGAGVMAKMPGVSQ